jgi:hypothetical protein
MKIEEFKQATPVEKTLKVKLVPKGKAVSVVVVDDSGTPWSAGHLLDITENGVKLHKWIDRSLDLPLDSDGKLVIID